MTSPASAIGPVMLVFWKGLPAEGGAPGIAPGIPDIPLGKPGIPGWLPGIPVTPGGVMWPLGCICIMFAGMEFCIIRIAAIWLPGGAELYGAAIGTPSP